MSPVLRVPAASVTTLAACLVALAAPAAVAEGGRFAVPGAATSGSSTTVGGGAVQLLLSLAIVVGAIVLLGWLARRLRVMPRGRSGALRVVDEIALGAKERAVILEVDGARLVLGVGEGRVALLHRAEGRPATAVTPDGEAVEETTGAPDGRPRFADLLQRALGR